MAWGDPARARFSLNESTLWSGAPDVDAPHRTSHRDAETALSRSRALFESGDAAGAQREIERLGASWSQAYVPLGDLVVRFEGGGGSADGDSAADGGSAADAVSPADGPGAAKSAVDGSAPSVERVLDLERSEHVVTASDGEQVSFLSRADEVLVHALPCPEGDRVVLEWTSPLLEEMRTDVSAGLDSAGAVDSEAGVPDPAHEAALDLVLPVPSDLRAADFRDEHKIAWAADGPTRAAVVVHARREAERLLVVCAIATSWQGLGRAPNRDLRAVLAEARAQAAAALARGEEKLRTRHRAHPAPGTDEVSLQLTGSPESEQLTTVFAYGRYLLAASSRPGLPPATLQGIWKAELEAPWSSNYTTNINLEMNHWGAGIAHVPEASAAPEEFGAMLREPGRETAHRLYGADGWTAHHNTDPWGYTDPVRGTRPGRAGRWAGCGSSGSWTPCPASRAPRRTSSPRAASRRCARRSST